jgi:hypothetical protein
MICKVCGGTQFNHFDDLGCDYDYCIKCNTAYDEEGNIIPEGPEPDMSTQEQQAEQDEHNESQFKAMLYDRGERW